MKLLVALSCAPSFASLRETNTFPARLLKRVPHKSSDTVATVKLMNEGGGHARLCVSVWVCVCDGVCVCVAMQNWGCQMYVLFVPLGVSIAVCMCVSAVVSVCVCVCVCVGGSKRSGE